MDRQRPRYRVFDMRDEQDGRPFVWCEVGVDFTPGNEVSPAVAEALTSYVNAQSWADLFWAAYVKNRKATIYEPLPF